ncbi:MAG TPA: hypothetical protein VMT69_00420 [Kineosporiaceae bacterium]|nr:hypothetical protein [Kineosporiaceae bacterium]
MKFTVLTDADGRVLATVPQSDRGDGGPSVGIVAPAGHTVVDVELEGSGEYASAEDLHAAVTARLASGSGSAD